MVEATDFRMHRLVASQPKKLTHRSSSGHSFQDLYCFICTAVTSLMSHAAYAQEASGRPVISQEKILADRTELEKLTVVLPPRLASALLERPDFCEVRLLQTFHLIQPFG